MFECIDVKHIRGKQNRSNKSQTLCNKVIFHLVLEYILTNSKSEI